MNWKESFPVKDRYYETESGILYCRNVIEKLKEFPNESVDLIATSPPYFALRNYGVEGQIGLEPTLEEYIQKLLAVTAELKRILKKTGEFWLNIGDTYGGSGCGRGDYNNNNRRTLAKAGLYADKPNPQRKAKPKCLLMVPERLAIRMVDGQGWTLRADVIWAKQVLIKKQHRTIGSAMPCSIKDRVNMTHEHLFMFTKSRRYYANADAVRIPYQVEGITENRPPGILRQKSYADSKYNVEPSFNKRVRDAERMAGQPGYRASPEEIKAYKTRRKRDTTYKTRDPERTVNPKGKMPPSVWLINAEPHNFRKELSVDTDHFAPYPGALVEIPIKFGCPPHGIVLDPFAGSGTTLLVADKLGFKWIGIEINPNYCEIDKRRLFQENGGVPKLF